jgi:hypothetical protein
VSLIIRHTGLAYYRRKVREGAGKPGVIDLRLQGSMSAMGTPVERAKHLISLAPLKFLASRSGSNRFNHHVPPASVRPGTAYDRQR